MRDYFKEILTLLGPDKRRLPGLLLLFFSASLLDLIGISLIGPYISIISNQDMHTVVANKIPDWLYVPKNYNDMLLWLSVGLISVFIIKAFSAIWINFVIVRFGLDQQVRLRSILLRRFQAMPYSYYLSRNSSDYIYSLQTLVGRYAVNIVSALVKMISDLIVAVVILIFLAWTNSTAFILLVLLLAVVVFSYDRVFRSRIKEFGKKSNIAASEMIKGINEGIDGLKEIRVLGKEDYFYRYVQKNSLAYKKYNLRYTLVSTAPRYLMELLMITFVVLLVLISTLTSQGMEMLLPTLGMLAVAAIRLFPAASALSTNLMRLRFDRDGLSRLYNDYINEVAVIKNEESDQSSDQFRELDVRNICFKYPTNTETTLDKIRLKIIAGESIGFIGPSGSGKSTLVDVLLGMLKPYEGKILYNGQELSDELNSWRSHVAYLPQQVFLIDNSIKSNVALGISENSIDPEKVIRSLKMSRLWDLVSKMPNGIETRIGEHGIRLSGGQRQRLALARAFYHERDVLILDESTSALDNETEKEVVEEIKRLKGKITMIVIAHRLTTVQHCDRIYKMDTGMIVASGTPSEILEPDAL